MGTKAKKVCLHQLALAKHQTFRFEDLPNELVIGIFGYLNMKELIKCGQVSKRLQEIVLDEQGSRKEDLLKIIQDLQCFICKKVPAPCGGQSKRYLCENSAHSFCESHKKSIRGFRFSEDKCPCGSVVDENSSQSIAKKLQYLPWICQNYKRGCREVKMDEQNLKIHHEKCIFRKVFCPHPDCNKSNRIDSCDASSCRSSYCWGKRVCFKDIFDHLSNDHRKIWCQINGESNKWTDFINGNFSNGSSWYPGKMTSDDGNVFTLVGRVHKYSSLTYT